jgi:hypothetical protein
VGQRERPSPSVVEPNGDENTSITNHGNGDDGDSASPGKHGKDDDEDWFSEAKKRRMSN